MRVCEPLLVSFVEFKKYYETTNLSGGVLWDFFVFEMSVSKSKMFETFMLISSKGIALLQTHRL